MCFATDSPFSNGQGNDYLFAGNMVYTVSVLVVSSPDLLEDFFLKILSRVCLNNLGLSNMHSRCLKRWN